MTTDALTSSLNADRPVLATISFGGKDFGVIRKPSTLLLAELARIDSGEDDAIGVVAEFFNAVLGEDTYKRFKRAVFTADEGDDTEVLMGLVAEVLEATLGRPTE